MTFMTSTYVTNSIGSLKLHYKIFFKLYYKKIYYTYKSNSPAKYDHLSLPTMPQSLALIEANKKLIKLNQN